jgi:hypothetical protein
MDGTAIPDQMPADNLARHEQPEYGGFAFITEANRLSLISHLAWSWLVIPSCDRREKYERMRKEDIAQVPGGSYGTNHTSYFSYVRRSTQKKLTKEAWPMTEHPPVTLASLNRPNQLLVARKPGARTNLPLPLTSFVGRAREKPEVKDLVSTSRLLTLVGAPGVGKTRLALEVAASMLDHFPDGVWLVELAPLADPVLVIHALAVTLGLQEHASSPLLQIVTTYLEPKQMLLVLDNCEHLLDSCAQLVHALLRVCPISRFWPPAVRPWGSPEK